MKEVAIALLLGFGVLVELASVLGLLLLRDPFDRLHFTAPAATLGPLALAAAVIVRESFSQAGVKALLVAVVLLVTNPVLTHATARAARIRAHGEWTVQEGEEVGEP